MRGWQRDSRSEGVDESNPICRRGAGRADHRRRRAARHPGPGPGRRPGRPDGQPPAPAAAATTVTTANGTHDAGRRSRPPTCRPTDATIKVAGKGFEHRPRPVRRGLRRRLRCAGRPDELRRRADPGRRTPPTAWAHITADGQGSGGVKAAWGADGSFSVTLALPSVTDGDVNCVTGGCSLYTASDDDSVRDRGQRGRADVHPAAVRRRRVRRRRPCPAPAIPQVIASPTIVAGGNQMVVFSGFKAGEQVNLTLFSAPITLSPVTAGRDRRRAGASSSCPPTSRPARTGLEAIGQTVRHRRRRQLPGHRAAAAPSPTPSPTPTPTPSSSASSSSAVQQLRGQQFRPGLQRGDHSSAAPVGRAMTAATACGGCG